MPQEGPGGTFLWLKWFAKALILHERLYQQYRHFFHLVAFAITQKVEVAAAKPEGGLEAAQIEDTSLPGMAFMMECYEGELKRPIRNLVNGRLLRTILIQVGPSAWNQLATVEDNQQHLGYFVGLPIATVHVVIWWCIQASC